MITFLASPKPFIGPSRLHQQSAIRSWLALAPDVEVILFGDAAGTAETAKYLGVSHVRDVETSEQGTPYFGAIASYAEHHGRYDTQAYINCDIVVTDTLHDMAMAVPFPQFLAIGQRIDLPSDAIIDVTKDGWKRELLDLARQELIHFSPPTACDYFVFRRGLWDALPTTVIGRAGFDNALVAYCIRRRIPVINATSEVVILHPFHDYDHVAGGKETVWRGDEAKLNLKSIGNCPALGTWDATWRFVNGSLQKDHGHGDWLRAAEIHARLVWHSATLGLILGLLGRWSRRLGISKGRSLVAEESVYRLLRDARNLV